eukprot:GHVN01024800.1.p2 GENE.GHVN01024800.1~~GHVN01024800.1.p2  ORF type:complete len:233 (+),score=80.48 GHVN01024800.1:863-1561(+)
MMRVSGVGVNEMRKNTRLVSMASDASAVVEGESDKAPHSVMSCNLRSESSHDSPQQPKEDGEDDGLMNEVSEVSSTSSSTISITSTTSTTTTTTITSTSKTSTTSTPLSHTPLSIPQNLSAHLRRLAYHSSPFSNLRAHVTRLCVGRLHFKHTGASDACQHLVALNIPLFTTLTPFLSIATFTSISTPSDLTFHDSPQSPFSPSRLSDLKPQRTGVTIESEEVLARNHLPTR